MEEKVNMLNDEQGKQRQMKASLGIDNTYL